MDTSQFKNIVDRYLKGEASAVDQAMIEAWLAVTEDNQVDLSEEELQAVRAEMLQHLRTHSGHTPPSAQEEDNPALATGITPQPPLIRRLLPWMQRVAVIVIFSIGIVSAFYYWHTTYRKRPPVAAKTAPPVEYRVRVTPANTIRRIWLPDSSLVILNRSGSLHYHLPFDKKNREVYLDAGEAFFEVKKNTTHPFIVHAGKTVTTVLGTSFNIRISRNVSSVKVVVKTGKVKVAAGLNKADSSLLLTPGQGIEINNQDNSIHPFFQPANITTSWWDERLVFNQNTMKEVVEALENRYQVRIRLRKPALQQYRVSGDFTGSHTLTSVLDAICLVHRLSYEKKNNEYFIF